MENEILIQHTSAVVRRVQLVTLSFLLLFSNVAIRNTVWPDEQKFVSAIIANCVVVAALFAVIFVSRDRFNLKVRTRVYFAVSLVIFISVTYLTIGNSLLTSIAFLPLLFTLTLLSFNKKFLIILLIAYGLLNAALLVLMPDIRAFIGSGYYLMIYLVLITVGFGGYQAIALFVRYDRELQTRFETILNQKTRLDTIFDASQDGILDFNLKTGEQLISPNALTLLDIKEQSNLDLLDAFLTRLNSQDLPFVQSSIAQIQHAAESRKQIEFDYRRTADTIRI